MKYRDLVRILSEKGFCFKRSKGSHEIWCKGDHTVVFPRRNGYDINRMLSKRILKEIGAA